MCKCACLLFSTFFLVHAEIPFQLSPFKFRFFYKYHSKLPYAHFLKLVFYSVISSYGSAWLLGKIKKTGTVSGREYYRCPKRFVYLGC